jgi:hypothetical protein
LDALFVDPFDHTDAMARINNLSPDSKHELPSCRINMTVLP